ncbi:serine/threonine-protein kinase [Streptomyces canus]|uniref:serine/threonine-protein kinase n=1 Tax=Streptomyces canus TaxID=58343 RepID=UPI0022585180|nr:serine/threonine-protein kinase [Streptomyces canus]MCX5254302.1 serine/threonine-protein kinase [Streptomyces canus]
MSGQRPASADDAAAALRQTGALPLRLGDPRRVGPYAPVALLGSGGMGRVYLARPADDSPGLVAVKVIRPEYAEDHRFRRRFEREASVHARLRTPHAPRLCGTGFEDELLWMATEYLPGFDLAEAVKAYGALETAAVWRLVAELGQALAGLAVEEIVHRDLKPSNVLLSVRGAHVIDFGISKAVDASAITGTGNRVGTPAYMSPEHLREGLSDTASDVFSLAGTLVYAATGRAPFGDGTGVDVMHRVAYEDPNPEVVGEIAEADAELGSLLTACLDKEPARRPTPRELIDAAGLRPVLSTWPEPLGGKVLARQQAYEALHRLPVEAMSRLRSPGDLPLPPSARVPEPAPRSPEKDESAAAAPPPGRPGPADVPARNRRKALLVAVAGIALCVVAAVALLLIRQDPPAAASPKAGATSADGTGPRDASSGSVSPSTSGLTRPDVDGAVEEDRDAEGTTTSTEPEASGSVGDQDDNAVPPGDTPSTAPTPTPSADSPSAGTDTAPWLAECTYYAGNGRTGLGDSGKRVQQVQCMLTERGYSVGSAGVDGEFGSGTETAVQAFQSERGLDDDGVVAHDTWVALRSAE